MQGCHLLNHAVCALFQETTLKLSLPTASPWGLTFLIGALHVLPQCAAWFPVLPHTTETPASEWGYASYHLSITVGMFFSTELLSSP